MPIHQTRKPKAVKEQAPANGNGQSEPKLFFTLQEAGKVLSLPLWTVRQLVRKGEIKRVRAVATRHWLIPKVELDRYAQLMTETAAMKIDSPKRAFTANEWMVPKTRKPRRRLHSS